MKGKRPVAVCAAFLIATAAHASQVTWGAYTSNGVGVADAGGQPLPLGDLVLLGHFNLTNAQITANGNNEAFLMANFLPYASSVIGAGNPNSPGPNQGYWLANSTNSSTTAGVTGQVIDYWLFNAPTVAAATQYGIYTASTSTNQTFANAWIFPGDTAIPNTTITDLSDVPHDSTGILWGSFEMDATPGSSNGTSPLYFLASFNAVPEPSTVVAASACAAALLVQALRRRRKMS